MSIPTTAVSMTINGRKVGPIEIPQDLMMLEFLQEYLNLTGTRYGCGQGVCHACSIIIDEPDGTSRSVPACITGAALLDGGSVRTIEGHAERDADGNVRRLSPIQQAYLEHFSFQCSYCTPGFVNGATVLLERLERQPVPRADVEKVVLEGMNDHICRCTGYVRYLEAVKDVVLSTPGLTIEDADERKAT
ncbi:(2Fe-2S)-binding protein [Afifella sp. JA880]|uniref:(2Fe-2S)-binding protein n=1 Tax=Afifella sp. JA880 TaxID=2975280 RepID=UPI0021BAEB35|nr:(2Fe-2S)-binding protein [Afifella sp. JA880]MCT8266275.1 (2Fe-2S)-binding protein [Afifella sp. JA880]